MEEEKKETVTQHFKLWLFAIIITMIFVLGRITAHADELEFEFDTAENMYHYYVVFYTADGYYMYSTDKAMGWDGGKLYMVGGTKYRYYWSGDGKKWTENTSVSGTAMNNQNVYTADSDTVKNSIAYSSYDIPADDGSVFFSLQLQAVVKTATPHLITLIKRNLTVILPVAVSCLASLMALAILPKKLQIFLH